MSLTSYAGLKAEVADWLNKTSLTAQIPTFIVLCEAQMRREITSIGNVDNYADVEIGADGWQLPCRADQVASVAYGGVPLPYISPDRAGEVVTNAPGFYTVDGNVLKVLPAGAVTVRLLSTFCSLSSSVSANWLLRDHPDVYLYGSLMQAAPFLRDDERMGVWAGLYRSAIDSINDREVRRQVGGNLQMQSGVTP